jgi:UDP-N-acetylglucosamine 4,6-dehydratase
MCGDVRAPSRLRLAFRGVDYVIHAAALKGVGRCEYDPGEAVLTNIEGTINVALACIDAGVKRAVFVSSDKACSPHNLYGMTKATGERLWLASNRYSAGIGTEFVAVRYGNVGGSNGSVIRKWMESAELVRGNGGKRAQLVLTDPECTRFHLRLPDAVELVLSVLQDGLEGSLYVPLLPSYRLRDLAEAFDPQAQKEVIGLQPGEKLHECMVNEYEAAHAEAVILTGARKADGMTDTIRIDPSFKGNGNVREYTSGRNTWRLSVEQLRQEIEWLKSS